MKSLKTKVARGIAFGDVSNSAIRNILSEISIDIDGRITEQDMYDALDFFDWKCPYTGKDLRNAIENSLGGYATDHIVPQNKEECGLNIRGNLVIVDKEANARKGNKNVAEFLLDEKNDALLGSNMNVRKERLDKIKKFQKKFGYDPEQMREALQPELVKIYDSVRKTQEELIKGIEGKLGVKKTRTKVALVPAKKKTPELILEPADENAFKEMLLSSKRAEFSLTYDTGITKVSLWKADKISEDSSIRANIQSRPFWRKRNSEGLVQVVARVLTE